MNPPSIINTIIAILLWILCGSVFIVLGTLYLVLLLIVTPQSIHPMTRFICRTLLFCAGQRLIMKGCFPDPSPQSYIYVFNHTSMLDTFIMLAILPEWTGAVGKKEQFSVPIWGAILKRFGAVPLDRKNRDAAIASMDEVGRSFADGRSLLVSPEGTRSSSGELGDFKKGPFHLAVRHHVPMIPTVIRGAYESKRKGDWRLRPNLIHIDVGPPLWPKTCAEEDTVDSFLNRVHSAFVKRLMAEPGEDHTEYS